MPATSHSKRLLGISILIAILDYFLKFLHEHVNFFHIEITKAIQFNPSFNTLGN